MLTQDCCLPSAPRSPTSLTLCFSVSPNATVRSSASAPVREGRDSVTLTCEADSNPAPTYIWVRGNGLGEVGRGPVLSLSPASRTDIDTYTCIASNSLGSSAPKSVDVDVYCELLYTSLHKPLFGRHTKSIFPNVFSYPQRDDHPDGPGPRAADRGPGRPGAGLRGGLQPPARHQLVQGHPDRRQRCAQAAGEG